MINDIERNQLNIFKSLGTLTQAQAIEYHELLNKEKETQIVKKEIVDIPVQKKKSKK